MFGRQLTNSDNRGGDVEKWPPVTVAGVHIWATKANAKTNGERRKSLNHGQLGTCGRREGVNKRRENHCGERIWLPERDIARNGNWGARPESL